MGMTMKETPAPTPTPTETPLVVSSSGSGGARAPWVQCSGTECDVNNFDCGQDLSEPTCNCTTTITCQDEGTGPLVADEIPVEDGGGNVTGGGCESLCSHDNKISCSASDNCPSKSCTEGTCEDGKICFEDADCGTHDCVTVCS